MLSHFGTNGYSSWPVASQSRPLAEKRPEFIHLQKQDACKTSVIHSCAKGFIKAVWTEIRLILSNPERRIYRYSSGCRCPSIFWYKSGILPWQWKEGFDKWMNTHSFSSPPFFLAKNHLERWTVARRFRHQHQRKIQREVSPHLGSGDKGICGTGLFPIHHIPNRTRSRSGRWYHLSLL